MTVDGRGDMNVEGQKSIMSDHEKESAPTSTPAPRTTWMTTRERAQGLLEYALLLALIALVAVAKVTDLGTRIGTMLDALGAAVSGVPVK
jgi:Flp pilus assembly pilin Flp